MESQIPGFGMDSDSCKSNFIKSNPKMGSVQNPIMRKRVFLSLYLQCFQGLGGSWGGCLYIYICIYTYTCVCMHVCMYVCTYVCMYLCMYGLTQTYVDLHSTSTRACSCIYIYMGPIRDILHGPGAYPG